MSKDLADAAETKPLPPVEKISVNAPPMAVPAPDPPSLTLMATNVSGTLLTLMPDARHFPPGSTMEISRADFERFKALDKKNGHPLVVEAQ